MEAAAMVGKGRSAQAACCLDVRVPVGCGQAVPLKMFSSLSQSVGTWQALVSAAHRAMLLEVSSVSLF